MDIAVAGLAKYLALNKTRLEQDEFIHVNIAVAGLAEYLALNKTR